MNKTALIIGVTSQDGSYLADLLPDHLRPLRANARAGIAADGEHADLHVKRNLPDQIATENQRAGKNGDDGDFCVNSHCRG